jgi:hypothetical protein
VQCQSSDEGVPAPGRVVVWVPVLRGGGGGIRVCPGGEEVGHGFR